jgi:H+/Cl- antiporter ClcA
MRSGAYRMLLAVAALIGLVVSAASWAFLELVHELQVWVYEDLPGQLGLSSHPVWWPLPWLALAGAVTAFAIARLPGHGGHVPAEGLKTGGEPTLPVELPGVLLAAAATLGLGLVLGPEAPLIALGGGLGILLTAYVNAHIGRDTGSAVVSDQAAPAPEGDGRDVSIALTQKGGSSVGAS